MSPRGGHSLVILAPAPISISSQIVKCNANQRIYCVSRNAATPFDGAHINAMLALCTPRDLCLE